jgi:hypothetical protein
MSEEGEHREAPEDVRALLGRIEEGWREVLSALEGIPEDRLEEPGTCGAWSTKNLMGHLAFWDAHVLEEIDRTQAGQPVEEVDFQALNDADQAEREGRTLVEERDAMQRTHAAVVDRLAGATGSDAAQLEQAIGRHTYEHYAAHARDIQRWRHRVSL